MRALVYSGPDDLAFHDAPDPTLESDLDAIVRPIASTPCDLDRAIVAGRTPLPPPFALGHECAAEVIDVGPGVTTVRPGDRVVVPWHISCGACARCRGGLPASCTGVTPRAMYGVPLGGSWGGLFSELVRVPFADAMLVRIPDAVRSSVAASASDNLTDAMMSVHRVLAGRPGARVLILGGTGAIGLFAVDFARAAGATAIDYVDKDPDRLDRAQGMGARAIERSAPGDLGEYQAVLDASGRPAELVRGLRALAPGGACHSFGIYFLDTPLPLLDMYAKDVVFSTGRPSVGPHIGAVLDKIAAGAVHPELLITELPWEDAPTALKGKTLKPVFVRP